MRVARDGGAAPVHVNVRLIGRNVTERFAQRREQVVGQGGGALGLAGGLVALARRAASPRPNSEAMPCDSAQMCNAIIIAGRPLSQVATPITPCLVGKERISRRSTIA